MAITYADLTDRQGGPRVYVRFQFAATPWKLTSIALSGADGDGSTPRSVRPLSCVTAIPTANQAAAALQQRVGYRQNVVRASITGDRIDPDSGRTAAGSLTLELSDADGYLASLFAVRARTRRGRITANMARTATSLTTSNSIAAGAVIFLNRECMVASSTGASPNVVRGANAAGSRQYAHIASTDSEQHQGDLFDGPIYWNKVGREVVSYTDADGTRVTLDVGSALAEDLQDEGPEIEVFVGYDHADLDEDDEIGPMRFEIRDAPEWSGDRWIVRADSVLRRLEKPLAANAFRGRLVRGVEIGRVVGGAGDSLQRLVDFYVEVAPGAESPAVWDGALTEVVHLMIGDRLVSATATGGGGQVWSFRVIETTPQGRVPDGLYELGADVREVLPSDDTLDNPRIGRVTYNAGFSMANFAASAHPLIAWLNLLVTRDGDSTNATANEYSYDCIGPTPISGTPTRKTWGAAWPVERVDQASFERVIDEFNVPFRRFLFGEQGVFNLRDLWDREIAPYFPLALTQNWDGEIECKVVGNVYPLDTATVVDLTHIERGLHNLRSVGRGVALGNRRASGFDAAAEQHVLDRSIQRVMAALLPAPAIDRMRLTWSLHNTITPGAVLTLTTKGPDVADAGGDYDIAADTWQAVNATISIPDGSKPGELIVDARRASDNTAHHGPAGTVSAWDAGTFTLTLNANDYTPTSTDSPYIPIADVRGFGSNGTQSNRGFAIALYTRRGVRLTNRLEVVTVTWASNNLVFASGFTAVGGGAYTPLAGDKVRLAPYDDTTVTNLSSYHADQNKFGAMATASTGLVNTTASAYRWGL